MLCSLAAYADDYTDYDSQMRLLKLAVSHIHPYPHNFNEQYSLVILYFSVRLCAPICVYIHTLMYASVRFCTSV